MCIFNFSQLSMFWKSLFCMSRWGKRSTETTSFSCYISKATLPSENSESWVSLFTEFSLPCKSDTFGVAQLTAEASGMFSQGSNCQAVSWEQPFLREVMRLTEGEILQAINGKKEARQVIQNHVESPLPDMWTYGPCAITFVLGKTWNTYKLTMIGDRCFKISDEIDVGNRSYFIFERHISEKKCHMNSHFLS